MRQTITLKQIPNQTLSTIVGGQVINLNLYTANKILFCDLYLNKVLIQSGIKCNQGTYINQYASDFVGYLFFWDTLDLEPSYINFGGTTTLNYSDTDLLEELFLSQVANG
jgi:hypothetical protein